MVSAASLSELRAKLTSANPDARAVALMHIQRHGADARELAVEVVKRLRDESPGVAWHVPGTFRALGAGVDEAAPELVRLLDEGKREGDGMLCSRTLHCLAVIGPAAADAALTPLLDWLGDDKQATGALEALLQIAPDDERVEAALIDALFSDDFDRWSSAARALSFESTQAGAGVSLRKRVVDLLMTRLGSPQREQAARLIARLWELDPERAVGAVAELIVDKEDTVVGAGLSLVIATGKGASAEQLMVILREREALTKRVVEALAALGEEAKDATDDLLSLLKTTDDAWLRAAAGKTLAAMAPDTSGLEEALSACLKAGLESGGTPDFYPLGDCGQALAVVGNGSGASLDTLGWALARSMQWWDECDYQVRDFLRKLLRGLVLAGPSAAPLLPELIARLTDTDLGAELVEVIREIDPDGTTRAEVEAAGQPWDGVADDGAAPGPDERELPPLPDDAPPPAGPELSDLAPDELADIARAVALAAERLDIVGAEAAETVAAVRRWIAREKHNEDGLDEELAALVSLLWGEQLVRACAWHWCNNMAGEERMLAVASPDGAFACLPMSYVGELLEGRKDNTTELLFNMIFADNLPPAHPEMVQILS